jgi:hypothetical protein
MTLSFHPGVLALIPGFLGFVCFAQRLKLLAGHSQLVPKLVTLLQGTLGPLSLFRQLLAQGM